MSESIASLLPNDRYAQAALSVGGLVQPALSLLADHLYTLDKIRFSEKGRFMSDDHLKQEAQRWAKNS